MNQSDRAKWVEQEISKLRHDTYDHKIFGTCEACEYARPVECVCGYEATDGFDYDDHILASLSDDKHHWAK